MRIGQEINTKALNPIERRAVESNLAHWGQKRSESMRQALIGGGIASLVCAFGWFQFSLQTGIRFGAVSIAVGLIVGLIVRVSGNGWSPRFGYLAAILSVGSCILGDFFLFLEFLSQQTPDLGLIDALMQNGADFFAFALSPLEKGWLFYIIAAFAAYKAGFHE